MQIIVIKKAINKNDKKDFLWHKLLFYGSATHTTTARSDHDEHNQLNELVYCLQF